MRLLKTGPYQPGQHEFQLTTFPEDKTPQYAILSHVWIKPKITDPVHPEVQFEDVQAQPNPRILELHKQDGSRKLEGAFQQAQRDGWGYIWADTTCINKASSSELSEAINSMYAWYRDAVVCYAYLADVPDDVDMYAPNSQFRHSEWWDRGWTLQELLAPKDVIFYSRNWVALGNKNTLATLISSITGIDADFLTGYRPLESASVAKRFSWAASRKTTRSEDAAYSLMGLFDVNMPMLYGEGSRAFKRLQEEVMKQSDDQSIFAWAKPQGSESDSEAYHGLLADSPQDFSGAGDKFGYHDWEERSPYVMSNRGLSIELHLSRMGPDLYVAALHCPAPPDYSGFLAIWLKKLDEGDSQYVRVRCNRLGSLEVRGQLTTVFVRQNVLRPAGYKVYPHHYFQLRRCEAAREEYEIIDIRTKELTPQELHSMPALTSHARTWVPRGYPACFKFSKGAKQLSAAVLFRRRVDSECFALLLGSQDDFEVGFEACGVEVLDGLEAMEKSFMPQPAGSPMPLRWHRVRVDAQTIIDSGRVLYVMDIVVESIQRDGILDRIVDVVDVVEGPEPIKNRRKIWQKIGLHKAA